MNGYLLGLPYHFPPSLRGALVPGGMALVLPGGVLESMLAPWRLSAREARRAIEAGTAIGHTDHLLKATPLG